MPRLPFDDAPSAGVVAHAPGPFGCSGVVAGVVASCAGGSGAGEAKPPLSFLARFPAGVVEAFLPLPSSGGVNGAFLPLPSAAGGVDEAVG